MKTRKIIQLIVDLLILISIILGLSWAILIYKVDFASFASLFMFLIVSLTFFEAFIDLILNIRFLIKGKANKSFFMYIFKFICAVGGFTSFLGTVCYLQYYTDALKSVEFLIVNICLNYIVPLLVTFDFIFLEIDTKTKISITFFGIATLLVYALYTLPLVNLNIIDDPYGFLSFTTNKWYLSVLFTLAFLAAGYCISILFYSLNHLFLMVYGHGNVSNDETSDLDLNDKVIVVKKEDVNSNDKTQEKEDVVNINSKSFEEENKEKNSSLLDSVESVKKDDNKKEDNKVENNKEKDSDNKEEKSRVYHVSFRKEDNRWAVKFQKGKRALKLFKTQIEAIDYAKEMAKKQNGSYRVHSLKGKIRKA